MSATRCSGLAILFISFDLYKPDFSECVETRFFFILANNSRSKQNETNLEHLFEHIGKWETCAKFQQNLLNCMVLGAQFFRQNTWFLKNNRALSKFLCGTLHYLISISK